MPLLICCAAFHSSVADEGDRELTTDELRSHPEVQGALKAIDAWLEGVYIYERLAGVSAGIVRDQDLIWSGGYGGEQAIRQWGDQLVSISIPSDDLENAMTRLNSDSDHAFLSVKDGEAPQSFWTFEIAEDGKAARFYQDDVYWTRIE